MKANKRRGIFYDTLIKIDTGCIASDRLPKYEDYLWHLLALERHGYIDRTSYDNYPDIFCITKEGWKFMEEFEDKKTKVWWDILKFFGGYLLGLASTLFVWYITHTC